MENGKVGKQLYFKKNSSQIFQYNQEKLQIKIGRGIQLTVEEE